MLLRRQYYCLSTASDETSAVLGGLLYVSEGRCLVDSLAERGGAMDCLGLLISSQLGHEGSWSGWEEGRVHFEHFFTRKGWTRTGQLDVGRTYLRLPLITCDGDHHSDL